MSSIPAATSSLELLYENDPAAVGYPSSQGPRGQAGSFDSDSSRPHDLYSLRPNSASGYPSPDLDENHQGVTINSSDFLQSELRFLPTPVGTPSELDLSQTQDLVENPGELHSNDGLSDPRLNSSSFDLGKETVFDIQESIANTPRQTSTNTLVQRLPDGVPNETTNHLEIPTIFAFDDNETAPPFRPSRPLTPLSDLEQNMVLSTRIRSLRTKVNTLFATFATLAEAIPAIRKDTRIELLEQEIQRILIEGRQVSARHDQHETEIVRHVEVIGEAGAAREIWQRLYQESLDLQKDKIFMETYELELIEGIVAEMCEVAAEWVDNGGY